MSILSSLGKLLKKIVSKILDLVKEIFKKIWPLILVIAIIYFAPVLAGYLGSAGAPAFLTNAFTWVGANVTPLVTSGLSSLWSGASTLISNGWSAFKAASMSTKLSVLSGAAALIAPEETAEFIGEAAEFVVDTATGIVGSVAGALFSNPWVLVGGAVALYFLLRKNKTEITMEPSNV
jgi:phage-related protein